MHPSDLMGMPMRPFTTASTVLLLIFRAAHYITGKHIIMSSLQMVHTQLHKRYPKLLKKIKYQLLNVILSYLDA